MRAPYPIVWWDAPSEAARVTGDEGLPAEGLLERVRAVVPLIASGAAEAEAQRRPLDQVIDALKATGGVPEAQAHPTEPEVTA